MTEMCGESRKLAILNDIKTSSNNGISAGSRERL